MKTIQLPQIKADILKWVIANTYRIQMEEVTTKQVASHFKISTQIAYDYCKDLASRKLITKLDPVNGDTFGCCGWIRVSDEEQDCVFNIELI